MGRSVQPEAEVDRLKEHQGVANQTSAEEVVQVETEAEDGDDAKVDDPEQVENEVNDVAEYGTGFMALPQQHH